MTLVCEESPPSAGVTWILEFVHGVPLKSGLSPSFSDWIPIFPDFPDVSYQKLGNPRTKWRFLAGESSLESNPNYFSYVYIICTMTIIYPIKMLFSGEPPFFRDKMPWLNSRPRSSWRFRPRPFQSSARPAVLQKPSTIGVPFGGIPCNEFLQ